MVEKGKILFESKPKNIPLKIFGNGIETYFFSNAGYFESKKTWHYKSIDEFTDVYPFEWKAMDIPFNSGIQLETADKKIAIISFNEQNKEMIIPLLEKIFGNKWNNISHKKVTLERFKSPGKIGQVGVHHSWKYIGMKKGWG